MQNTRTVALVNLGLDLPPLNTGILKIAISTMYLCQLCKSETVSDILIKLFTDVKHYETRCRT